AVQRRQRARRDRRAGRGRDPAADRGRRGRVAARRPRPAGTGRRGPGLRHAGRLLPQARRGRGRPERPAARHREPARHRARLRRRPRPGQAPPDGRGRRTAGRRRVLHERQPEVGRSARDPRRYGRGRAEGAAAGAGPRRDGARPGRRDRPRRRPGPPRRRPADRGQGPRAGPERRGRGTAVRRPGGRPRRAPAPCEGDKRGRDAGVIPLPLSAIAEMTGGAVHGPPDAVVDGPVVVDSRQAAPGALFAALKGERADGHDFAPAALAAGAAAVLAQRPVEGPCVVVPDVQEALGRLARGVLDRLPDVTVTAVTGSAGKTSAKDLIGQLAGRAGPTVFPPGSFNNEIGLPLTVLRADAGTRHLVLEMGARGIGHIAYLTGIAPPDVGVVLNVGTAHVGEFGGRENIALAKGE